MSDKLPAIEVVSKYVAALAARDTGGMNDKRAEEFELDFVYSDASASGPLSSEETKQFWPSWLAGFPEMDYEVIRTLASEDVVVTEWVFTGTHSVRLEVFDPPIEPTGRTIRFRGVSIYDLGDGLIQKETTYMDFATLVVELGVAL